MGIRMRKGKGGRKEGRKKERDQQIQRAWAWGTVLSMCKLAGSTEKKRRKGKKKSQGGGRGEKDEMGGSCL